MQWNLRLAAAQRGIWRSSDLRRLLAEAGLEISAGKMSHLWSGRPISVRLDDLDIICAVLGCEPGDLLIRDPAAAKPADREAPAVAAASCIRRSGRHGAAAGRCRRYEHEHVAGGHLHRVRGHRARPRQARPVPALLCPVPAPGAALRRVRAGPQAPGRGVVRPLLPAVADHRCHLSRLWRARPVHLAGRCQRCKRRAAARPGSCRDCGSRSHACGRAAARPVMPGPGRSPVPAPTAVT